MDWLSAATRGVSRKLRSTRSHYGFTIVILLIVAVTLTTTVLVVVRAIFVDRPPYIDSDRLVYISRNLPLRDGQIAPTIVLGAVPEWRRQTEAFAEIGAIVGRAPLVLVTGQDRSPLSSAMVSAAVFQLLGVRPKLGRLFGEEDEHPSASRVAILSHAAWLRYFGGDSRIVGRDADFVGERFNVIGVMPPEFVVHDRRTEVWVPLVVSDNPRVIPVLLARVEVSRSFAAARAEADSVYFQQGAIASGPHGLVFERGPANPGKGPRAPQIKLIRVTDVLRADTVAFVFPIILTTAALVVVTAVSIWFLLLLRMAGRERELKIRLAVGASHRELMVGMIGECLLITFVAGAVGTGLSALMLPFVADAANRYFPTSGAIRIDRYVVGVVMSLSGIVGVFTGAFQVIYTLRAGEWASPDEPREISHRGYAEWSLVTQVALATALLLAGATTVRNVVDLARRGVGYSERQSIAVQVPAGILIESGSLQPTIEQWLVRLRSFTQVQHVAVSGALPSDRSSVQAAMSLPGSPDKTPVSIRLVTSGYDKAIGLKVIEGSFLEAANRDPIAVVDSSFREYLPDHSLVGLEIGLSGPLGLRRWRIVGVVDTVRPPTAERKLPDVYLNFAAVPSTAYGEFIRELNLLVKTDANPALFSREVRQIVMDSDQRLVVTKLGTLKELSGDAMARPFFAAQTFGVFAVSVVVFTLMGLCSLTDYVVRGRRLELGIRSALGSPHHKTVWSISKRIVRASLVGVGFGVILAHWLTSAVTRSVPSTLPTDPMVWIVVSCAMPAMLLMTSYVRMWQLIRVHNLPTLR